jgi:hypothetical protein
MARAISGDPVSGIIGADGVEIGFYERQRSFRESRLQNPRDPGEPLAAAARLVACEIVEAGTCMGVDHAEGGGLLLQMKQDAREHDVLDDIGEVAGVKGMAVVHAASSTPRCCVG